MFQKPGGAKATGKLEGEVAAVTGGNSGTGLATAGEFRREGARFVITGRDARTLAEAARGLGGDVLALRSDSSSLADVEAPFDAVRERFVRVDVLFVNAGVGMFAPPEETGEGLFDQVMDINFKGAYFTGRRARRAAELRRVRREQGRAHHAGADALGRTRLARRPRQRRQPRAGRGAHLRAEQSSFLVGAEAVADGGTVGFKVQGVVVREAAAPRAEAARGSRPEGLKESKSERVGRR